MISKKSARALTGAGIITAIGASLCCITPVFTLLAGSSHDAIPFFWIQPLRPFLMGITIAFLGLAWLRKLKPAPEDPCSCRVDTNFLHSKRFLTTVTLFAALMMALPYAHAFHPKTDLHSEIGRSSESQKGISLGRPIERNLSNKAGCQQDTGIKKHCCQRN